MNITATDAHSHAVKVTLDGNTAQVVAGGSGSAGAVLLHDETGVNRVTIQSGKLDVDGSISQIPPVGGVTPVGWSPLAANVTIDGEKAVVNLGGKSRVGELFIAGESATAPGAFVSGYGSMTLYDPQGRQRAVMSGVEGTLVFFAGSGKERVRLSAVDGALRLRGPGGKERAALAGDGSLRLHDDDSQERVAIEAENGTLHLRSEKGVDRVALDANRGITVGAVGHAGHIAILGDDGLPIISIRGSDGDIVLEHGDCTEDFDVSSEEIEPGTVMVIGPSSFRPSTRAYDRTVGGVISGAGDTRPAIRLGHRPSTSPRKPLALTGRVHCLVDASEAPIEIGDLLTTSDVPGHAMKAADPTRAFGAVIGKALAPLPSGRGTIPILVALQ